MICAGIDGGSRAIKIVLLEGASCEVVASGLVDAGPDPGRRAEALLERLLASKGLARPDLRRIVATGYARNAIGFADATVTEISCHAAGVRRVVTEAATVIDVGGQDSKLIRLARDGTVRDFAMNDRCAAGTGRFLEVVAERLGVGLEELGHMALRSREPSRISSTCVVFAETEIVGLLASGARPEDIASGVQASIASRVAALAGREVESPVVFTGGVALVPGMAEALGHALGVAVVVAPEPQMTGAIGAALAACRDASGSSA